MQFLSFFILMLRADVQNANINFLSRNDVRMYNVIIRQ